MHNEYSALKLGSEKERIVCAVRSAYRMDTVARYLRDKDWGARGGLRHARDSPRDRHGRRWCRGGQHRADLVLDAQRQVLLAWQCHRRWLHHRQCDGHWLHHSRKTKWAWNMAGFCYTHACKSLGGIVMCRLMLIPNMGYMWLCESHNHQSC